MDFVVVKDPITKTIEVATKGPKGDPGMTPDLSVYQTRSEKGQANGYAGLGGTSKVPVAQLPIGAAAGTVAAGDDGRFAYPWKDVFSIMGSTTATTMTGAGNWLNGAILATSTTGLVAAQGWPFNPALWINAGMALEFRCVYEVWSNGIDPGRSFDFGVYPMTAPITGVTTANIVPTIGSVVIGTTATAPNPGVGAFGTPQITSPIAAPAAGRYTLGITVAGGLNANSRIMLPMRVQVRNVPA